MLGFRNGSECGAICFSRIIAVLPRNEKLGLRRILCQASAVRRPGALGGGVSFDFIGPIVDHPPRWWFTGLILVVALLAGAGCVRLALGHAVR
ncbi:MAG: hypothetical protein EPN41_08995, partial [Candidimonas sp.]